MILIENIQKIRIALDNAVAAADWQAIKNLDTKITDVLQESTAFFQVEIGDGEKNRPPFGSQQLDQQSVLMALRDEVGLLITAYDTAIIPALASEQTQVSLELQSMNKAQKGVKAYQVAGYC